VALGYLTPPHTIDVSNVQPGGYGSTIGNMNEYLSAAGSSLIASTDLSSTFQNNVNFRFLNLGQQNTVDKMQRLMERILIDVPSADGLFIDHVEPSTNQPVPFGYPDALHSLLLAFKSSQVAQGKNEPVIAANFFSLRQHSQNNYRVYNDKVFDAILVEDYNTSVGSDHTPADIIDFHKKNPQAIIIINTAINDLGNPSVLEHFRAREAVTISALVGGLHAIDRGSSDHGDNTYSKLFLNFPNLQLGRPLSQLIDNANFFRRDYVEMLAIYAKQNGTVPLPTGVWHNYWDNFGHGAALSGQMGLVGGGSYLLFRDK